MHPLRNILNKLIWSGENNLKDYIILYIHRGAPGNSKSLSASSIIKISGSWFSFKEGEEEKIIPFHRVTLIVNLKTGELLWRKLSSSG
jgi:uncharacterized protein (UPF0248 family)